MAPIRRMPHDVLEQIFIACLPAHRNCVMSAQEAPVLLGRICSSWRSLSLATPRLWCRLHIVLPNSDRSPSFPDLCISKIAQRLEVASTWLTRSGDCPLSISLERNLYPGSDLDPQEKFLELLTRHILRWQNMRLSLTWQGGQRLSELSENDAPLLASLDLSLPSSEDAWTWSPSSILHTPSLSRFGFFVSCKHPWNLPLRWSNLTDLLLRFSSWDGQSGFDCRTAQDIVSRCHMLQRCKFIFEGISAFSPPDNMSYSSSLRVLELQCYRSPIRTSGYLFKHLSLPRLREFKLIGSQDSDDPQDGDLGGLTSTLVSCASLETILIQVEVFTKPALIFFLESLPSTVQCLEFIAPSLGWEQHSLDDDVLQVLEAGLGHPVACPALRELTINVAHLLSDDALCRFVVSRAPTLRRVHITFLREKQVDILTRLQSFIAAGLEICVEYRDPPALIHPRFSPWEGLCDYDSDPLTLSSDSQDSRGWRLSSYGG
ncbi:hypothetical protein R3P38DRAFT_2978843 [Favolaschia claudopus]|uniref:F-box domain-containing protein n=1 Tax=Favolaschia claudopus TaxID=2862362 RepID=A0AAW0AZ85_9AGAR